MQLPTKLTIDLMQTKWKSILDPVIANPLMSGHLIKNVLLPTGGVSVSVNHKLGRKLIGWIIVRNRAVNGVNSPGFICDLQDQNQQPELTLVLTNIDPFGGITTDANLDIYVF